MALYQPSHAAAFSAYGSTIKEYCGNQAGKFASVTSARDFMRCLSFLVVRQMVAWLDSKTVIALQFAFFWSSAQVWFILSSAQICIYFELQLKFTLNLKFSSSLHYFEVQLKFAFSLKFSSSLHYFEVQLNFCFYFEVQLKFAFIIRPKKICFIIKTKKQTAALILIYPLLALL